MDTAVVDVSNAAHHGATAFNDIQFPDYRAVLRIARRRQSVGVTQTGISNRRFSTTFTPPSTKLNHSTMDAKLSFPGMPTAGSTSTKSPLPTSSLSSNASPSRMPR